MGDLVFVLETADELLTEVETLRHRYAALIEPVERLLAEVRGGLPLSRACLEECWAAADAYDAVFLASAAHAPDAVPALGLNRLAADLRDRSDRQRWGAVSRASRADLMLIRSMTHDSGHEPAYLAALRSEAAELSNKLSPSEPPADWNPDEWVERVAPFRAVLRLSTSDGDLPEVEEDRLFDIACTRFGKTVALAAARRRLRVGASVVVPGTPPAKPPMAVPTAPPGPHPTMFAADGSPMEPVPVRLPPSYLQPSSNPSPPRMPTPAY